MARHRKTPRAIGSSVFIRGAVLITATALLCGPATAVPAAARQTPADTAATLPQQRAEQQAVRTASALPAQHAGQRPAGTVPAARQQAEQSAARTAFAAERQAVRGQNLRTSRQVQRSAAVRRAERKAERRQARKAAKARKARLLERKRKRLGKHRFRVWRNKRIARSLVKHRYRAPRRQFHCLKRLWARESGWNHRAHNGGSGAYGIPQALPAGKMAAAGRDWRTSPRTQIRWGLRYIKSRYGKPCRAWRHLRRTGWY